MALSQIGPHIIRGTAFLALKERDNVDIEMVLAAYVALRLYDVLPKQKCKRARVADRDVVTFDTFWESFGT